MHLFLEGYCIYWEIVQRSVDWVIFSTVVCLFPKMLVSVMRSFRVIIIISIEYPQPSFHSAVLCIFRMVNFSVILFCQRTFFQCISEYQSHISYRSSYIFRSIILKWEQPLEVVNFSKNNFFRKSICLEQLFLSYNYFLTVNTFLISYFLKLNTFQYRCCFGGPTSSE